ncbi:hypothetical protein AAY473_027823 [Plecturocebus cupreus]
MDAQQERCKSQDGLGPVALLPSAAGSPSRRPVSRKKPRSPGPRSPSQTPVLPPAPGAQGLSAPGLQVAASGASASAPASTSASLAPQAARDSQVTPMDIDGQQQGTRGLKQKRAPQPAGPAASGAARASSSAPRQPAQGTTAQSATGDALRTTSTVSPAAKRKPAPAAGPAGTVPGPSAASPRGACAASP